jgi:N-acetylmuramoyl-L-alanine amidase
LVRLPVLLALIVWLLAPSAALAEATVRDIRLAPMGDGTRVVIDLSRKVSYRHLKLDHPDRLAIDLPEVAWLVPQSIGAQAVGVVDGYRFGRFQPGVSRLVFDIEGPFAVEDVFELPSIDGHGYRIVTDLVALPAETNGTDLHHANGSGHPEVNGNGLPVMLNGSHGADLLERPRPKDPEVQTAAFTGGIRAIPVPKPAYPPTRRVVILDPGHGGVDPGAISATNVKEKDIVLEIAHRARRKLEALGRYQVVMTRSDDSFVRLRERLDVARHSGGELFVSMHADSLPQAPGVRGAAVYTLSERASTQEAAELAAKENRADILGGIDLTGHEALVRQILIDLAQRDANNRSIRLAEAVIDELDDVTLMARSRRQQAGFVVLKSPDMPSVLLELGYLSNDLDQRRLQDGGYQDQLASAIVTAIEHYFLAES